MYLLISLFASLIGAICGIGGGVIIKPVLDLLTNDGSATINFLSSCTVFSMSLYSVLKEITSGKSKIDYSKMIPLGIGSAIGGLFGNSLFSFVKNQFENPNIISGIQSICLSIVVIACTIYTLNKSKIKTMEVKNPVASCLIGFFLGTMSSFLGIGGGPINLVVLYFFFSLTTKSAATCSIFIILFGQITNLGKTILSHSIPPFDTLTLILMIAGGIGGGIIGRKVNKKIDDDTVDKLFYFAMGLIIIACMINIKKYLF